MRGEEAEAGGAEQDQRDQFKAKPEHLNTLSNLVSEIHLGATIHRFFLSGEGLPVRAENLFEAQTKPSLHL